MESRKPLNHKTLSPSSLSVHSYSFSKSQRFPSKSKITPSNSPIRRPSTSKNNPTSYYTFSNTHNLTLQNKAYNFIQDGQGSVGRYRNYKQNKTNPYQKLKSKSPRYKNHDNTSPTHAQLGGWPDSKRWFMSNKSAKKSSISKNKECRSPHRQNNKLISQKGLFNKSMKKSEYLRLTLNIEEFNHNEIVGPGSYTIAQKQIGNYTDSRYKNSSGYSFGKSPRSPIKPNIQYKSPKHFNS